MIRVYLDFDDVVNFFGNRKKHRTNTGFDTCHRARVTLPMSRNGIMDVHATLSPAETFYAQYAINYAPDVIQAINRWAKTPNVEVVWLTTWQKLMRDVEKALHIHTPNRVVLFDYTLPTTIAKRDAIRGDLINSNVDAVVWADDKVIGGLNATTLGLPENALLVEPVENEWGLTKKW